MDRPLPIPTRLGAGAADFESFYTEEGLFSAENLLLRCAVRSCFRVIHKSRSAAPAESERKYSQEYFGIPTFRTASLRYFLRIDLFSRLVYRLTKNRL